MVLSAKSPFLLLLLKNSKSEKNIWFSNDIVLQSLPRPTIPAEIVFHSNVAQVS